MNLCSQILIDLEKGLYNNRLLDVYCDDDLLLRTQLERYTYLITSYIATFGDDEVEIYSAPGRTEIGGNHTDHQHGCVLAASINLDVVAVVSTTSCNTVTILSEGYDLITIDLDNLSFKQDELNTTTALIKGILSKLKENHHIVGGFKAYIASDVITGSGLSSSAAFETIIGSIISGLYNNLDISPVELAQIGKYAENVYMGKPCGLMDQMACSVGGAVFIDFADTANPVVKNIELDLSSYGYSLCIVDTKASHSDLTDAYASIPFEMKCISAFFGKQVLREVSTDDFMKALPTLMTQFSHRAILRAIHFFHENERAFNEFTALSTVNFTAFLNLVKESGNSSFKYLQNVYVDDKTTQQPVSLCLALTDTFIGDNGVCRVHGGGFAGTIQVILKNECVYKYKKFIEDIFGEDTCHILKIRKNGGVKVL